MELSHSHRVLLYRYMCKEVTFSEQGTEHMGPDINELESVDLHLRHQKFFTDWIEGLNIDVNTLGVNLVLIAFCELYPINMYPIFVANYHRVREIALIESILNQINNKSIALPKNLIVSKQFGLKANRHVFNGNKLMSMQDLNMLVKSMRLFNDATVFIELLKPFHFVLVNAIYLFTSISSESKTVLEATEIYATRFDYKLPTLVPITYYQGDWWFEIKSMKMFAFFNGQITMNTYVGEITMQTLKQKFKNLIVVGFVYKESLYPIMIDSQPYVGNWELTNQTIGAAGYPILLKPGEPSGKKIGFVRSHSNRLYRLKE